MIHQPFPVISLIIPTSNRDSSLESLLDSLTTHNWLSRKDIEVIVVSNNINKIDEPKARKLCSHYNNVRYYYSPRKGKSNALNCGIRLARGYLLAFIDDDILIKDNVWLDKMADHFKNNPHLGYVSGNIKAANLKTEAQIIWERRGGLSKGDIKKYFSKEELANNYKNKIWPLFEICAGGNSMIPKKVFYNIGGFNPIFDPGAPIPHGATLEIGYRIIKAGYDLMYDPSAGVLHKHPESSYDLRKKLFVYSMGVTSMHAYLFLLYHDYRSLRYSLFGHFASIAKKSPASLLRTYPVPVSFLTFSALGAILGPFLLIIKSFHILDIDHKLHSAVRKETRQVENK